MSQNNSRKVFVNIPVRDLKKSMEFFKGLGFGFNKQFTDDKAACMVLSEEAFVMLLSEPFFKGFTTREQCDTSRHAEALLAISCNSRDEVIEMVNKAVASGGKNAMPAQDHGFMYGWSFLDPDGHQWEPLWMDPKAVMPQELA